MNLKELLFYVCRHTMYKDVILGGHEQSKGLRIGDKRMEFFMLLKLNWYKFKLYCYYIQILNIIPW